MNRRLSRCCIACQPVYEAPISLGHLRAVSRSGDELKAGHGWRHRVGTVTYSAHGPSGWIFPQQWRMANDASMLFTAGQKPDCLISILKLVEEWRTFLISTESQFE
jgi:hypothetical protein